MPKQGGWITRRIQERKEAFEGEGAYQGLGIFWSWGWRIALEWGSAVAVGAFLGYCADTLWDLDAICLVMGLFLGSMAGVLNIYRSCQKHFERQAKRALF